MADWTSQPPDGYGLNAAYSGGLFLWNGIAPTKNQLNGATTTAVGTNSTGNDGKYQYFNAAGPMSWSITKPATAYTLCALIAMPTSDGFSSQISIPGGNFRIEFQRTGGGVYVWHVHTGSASPGTQYVEGTSAPDTEMITYVATYDGTTLKRWLKLGDGTNASNLSEALSYNNSGSSQIDLGNATAANYGLYGLMLLNNDVGGTEAVALRDNGWRMFSDTLPPTLSTSSVVWM